MPHREIMTQWALRMAIAEPARKYAVLSIVGDRMLVVNHITQTGTRVDRDRRDFIAMPARALDDAMLAAMQRAIRNAAPQSEVVMLAATPLDQITGTYR